MTLQARCIIAYPNYMAPQVGPGLTSVPSIVTPAFPALGAWNANFPLTNLLKDVLYRPIKTTGVTLANSKFDTDFGVARPISVVALVRHNLTPVVGTSKVRIRLSNDPTFAVSLYDSTWKNAYQALYAPASLPWGWDPAVWTGGPTQEDVQSYRNMCYTHVADALYVARYMRVEIDDTTNAAGYIRIGNVFAGPGFQPLINMSYGARIGWRDPSTASPGETGTRFYVTRPKYRQAEFTLEHLSVDQGLELPFEMEGRIGITGSCYFVMDPTTLYHMQRWSFPANLEELSPLEFPYFNSTSKGVKLVERI